MNTCTWSKEFEAKAKRRIFHGTDHVSVHNQPIMTVVLQSNKAKDPCTRHTKLKEVPELRVNSPAC